MSRRSPVDVCMLCGEAPCECNKKTPVVRKKPTEAKPKAEAAQPVPQSDRERSRRDQMKAAAAAQRTMQTGKPAADDAVPATLPKVNTDDAMLHEAIRNLGRAEMLCEADYSRWQAVITAEPSVTERAQTWKQRRTGYAEADR